MVFTDLVDSTRTGESLGDARAAELWSEHNRRARSLFAHRGGREIDRTDGFFVVFESVQGAAAFAREYHGAIADLGLSARVGINVGPATLRENSAEDVAHVSKPVDVEGLAKALTARETVSRVLCTRTARAACTGAGWIVRPSPRRASRSSSA